MNKFIGFLLLTISMGVCADDTLEDAEYCVSLSSQLKHEAYVERLEKLVTDLYYFRVQRNMDIAEENYLEQRK